MKLSFDDHLQYVHIPPKLNSNHRWFLLKHKWLWETLPCITFYPPKNKNFWGSCTINDSRERKERVWPVSFPILSSKTRSRSHFLSSSPPSEPHGCLAQPKYWGTTDMRKHTPRLHLQNPLLDTHTHTKRRDLFSITWKVFEICFAAWSNAKNVPSDTLHVVRLTSTAQSLTHTCRTLHQAWWQPQEHRICCFI